MPHETLDIVLEYAAQRSKQHPALWPALRGLAAFVGLDDVKEAVASHVQEVLSADMSVRARSSPVATRARTQATAKRKRKPTSHRWTNRKNRRQTSTAPPPTSTKQDMVERLDMVSRAIMQSMGCEDDSDDSDFEIDDEETVASCRPRHLRDINLHTLLLGSPGTGKTSLALVLSRIWAAVGLVEPGKFSAVTRADLVGKFQGHSTAKVRKLLAAHQNGVLFIDEAYAIVTDDKDSFGAEVLAQIVESMTNPNHHVTFIMAGYADAVRTKLLGANEGLERRFGAIYAMQRPDAAQRAAIFDRIARKLRLKPTFAPAASEPFFRNHADAFRYAGGDLEVLAAHTKRAHVRRRWPAPLNRCVTLDDLESGFRSFARDKQRSKSSSSVAQMYM